MSGAVLRLLLACLLTLAIPLQGMASVGLHLCSGHASAVSNGPEDHAHDHAHVVGHDLDDSSGLAATDDASHHPPWTKSGCSACAPCCAVAALMHARLQLPEAAPSSSAVALSEAVDIGVDADVLQRPPRISLA
jgi:hypothetical protein